MAYGRPPPPVAARLPPSRSANMVVSHIRWQTNRHLAGNRGRARLASRLQECFESLPHLGLLDRAPDPRAGRVEGGSKQDRTLLEPLQTPKEVMRRTS